MGTGSLAGAGLAPGRGRCMSRRYLITGAQGFVGRRLVARLLAADPDAMVVGIGRSPRRDPIAGDDRYRYASVSLADTDRLRALVSGLRPACVFHLASALHSAPEAELASTNVAGTTSL